MGRFLLGSLKSKTVWLNAAWIAIAVLEVCGQLDIVKQNPDVVAICIAVSNLLARAITTQPLSDKAGPKVKRSVSV